MDIGENSKLGSDSQDSDDVQVKNKPTSLGVQNAKKRLRAFSIQKKTSLSPVAISKPVSSGSATVFIGKLASVKSLMKTVDDPDKKLPKPPKPGATRQFQDSYMHLRKNTLSEIEDMKRKMELVELGIPLGLICPAPNSDKAMPTKAMPPIKSFLARKIRIIHPVKAIKKPPTRKKEPPPGNPAKVDEIIREAKKAKAEGKEFKFNYNKLLPDYDNPFQRKKDEIDKKQDDKRAQTPGRDKHSKRSDKYDSKRHYNQKTDKDSYRDRRKPKEREKRGRDGDDRTKDREEKSKDKDEKKGYDKYESSKSKSTEVIKEEIRKEEPKKEEPKSDRKETKSDYKKTIKCEAYKDGSVKETDVNLKDFLVCDSWSLDNEDKSKDASPKSLAREEVKEKTPPKFIDPMEQLRHSLTKKEVVKTPVNKPKIAKLQPVIDSFKFEIEEDDDLLDMFDENSSLDKFAKTRKSKAYTSPLYDFGSKDVSMDEMADDTFLESVINEIKAEDMDETSQDKGLVEYESPNRESVTPELDSSRSSRRSDYSDGFKSIESYKSTESGYKSTESGYKSTDSGYKIAETYRQEDAYKAPGRGFKCSETDYKNMSESYSTPERPYKPLERSFDSQERSYKSDRSYGSPERHYVSSERSYSSLERSYRSTERSYNSPERFKSQERGYESPERQYKSLERNYKSTEPNYKSNERSYSSPDIAYKQTDINYKYTETGYKSPENAYNVPARNYRSPERIYRSPEMAYKSNESYKSDRSYDMSPQMAYKSVDRGYKSPDVAYKSSERDYQMPEASYNTIERGHKSDRKESRSPNFQHKTEVYKSTSKQDEEDSRKITRSMMDSLETWDFVLKVCQPLLFRHDRNRCYKETRFSPKLWYNENPKLCDCIKDRTTVYEELEMTKMELVDTVYACDQVREASFPTARGWYPSANQCLVEHSKVQLSSEWEADDSQLEGSATPQRNDEMSLDREYHRFMKSVWPDVESKSETPRSTPVRETKKPDEEPHPGERRKKVKLSSEGWSQESDFDDDEEKSKEIKGDKEKRKRKRSTSTVSDGEVDAKKRKKLLKKKDAKKSKAKSSKRLSKKVLKKLKEKHKKKKKVIKLDESDDDSYKKERKKKDKKAKKKKQQKQKKKNLKKKKSRKRSSSSSSSTESSSDSEFEKKNEKKKRKKSSSESTQEELFDVNILNNIKTERLTDDEKILRTKPREIIDVKELQNDFVGNSIQIKKEVEEVKEVQEPEEVELKKEEVITEIPEDKSESQESQASEVFREIDLADIKIPDDPPPTPQLKLPEESTSQSSSSSIQSNKEPVYEKDESHLRPSSQNSNYSFQDVMQSQGGYQKEELEDQHEDYEGNYEMYEQMAMEYQSDVASQRTSPPCMFASQRIETVVRARSCGEIKCDWRPGDRAATHYTPQRPSRWGLKPSEVNIVLTGGTEQFPIQTVAIQPEPVYKIQSIANRTDNSNTGYDEAYQDMYGASDKLQYGDCFKSEERPPEKTKPPERTSTLDDRIDLALRTTVLGEVAKESQEEEKNKDKGILATKPAPVVEPRSVKRVSFADGYKPGQDSDVEEPPIKKKKKIRRYGCAWPCGAAHPDHVPLWDALPPPPPPPGSPPPRAPALLLLRGGPPPHALMQAPPHHMPKFDPSLPFMPPEPPPGMINF